MEASLFGQWMIRLACFAFVLELGGSLYEYAVVDPVWPSHRALIRPGEGGLDRKRFWAPLHGVVTLALPLALWLTWPDVAIRGWLLWTLGLYVALRAWTFAYFIPRAIRFERGELDSADDARRWTRWSLLRLPLLMAATACCLKALGR